MAPREIELQTDQIIKCLFDDENLIEFRGGAIEHDGPADDDDTFDAVIIADKLKEVADNLNKDAEFQAAVKQLRQVAAEQAMVVVLSQSVEALCKTSTSQNAEVAQEMQLINASVALVIYIKKSAPELRDKVCTAMNTFLNTRVGDWVAEQGGWNAVADNA